MARRHRCHTRGEKRLPSARGAAPDGGAFPHGTNAVIICAAAGHYLVRCGSLSVPLRVGCSGGGVSGWGGWWWWWGCVTLLVSRWWCGGCVTLLVSTVGLQSKWPGTAEMDALLLPAPPERPQRSHTPLSGAGADLALESRLSSRGAGELAVPERNSGKGGCSTSDRRVAHMQILDPWILVRIEMGGTGRSSYFRVCSRFLQISEESEGKTPLSLPDELNTAKCCRQSQTRSQNDLGVSRRPNAPDLLREGGFVSSAEVAISFELNQRRGPGGWVLGGWARAERSNKAGSILDWAVGSPVGPTLPHDDRPPAELWSTLKEQVGL